VTKKLLKECKEYWSVNFNDRRIHETRTQFRKALIGSGFSLGQVAEIQSVGDLTSDSDQQNESDKLVWLFYCCTDELFRIDDSSVTKQPLPPDDLAKVLEVYVRARDAESYLDALEVRLGESKTSWDIYLRSLTPDLPTYLSDWLAVVLRGRLAFPRYWAELRNQLSPQSANRLAHWYLTEAKKRSHPDLKVVLPPWMSN